MLIRVENSEPPIICKKSSRIYRRTSWLWPEPGSNWRPHTFQACALPTELSGRNRAPRRRARDNSSATLTGLEPATSAVTGRRANQLRHRALFFCFALPRLFDFRVLHELIPYTGGAKHYKPALHRAFSLSQSTTHSVSRPTTTPPSVTKPCISLARASG